MARGKNKPKLTNKQIEHHLNNLYHSGNITNQSINNIMKIVTFFIEYKGDTADFEKFLQEKVKKDEKKDK